MRLRPVATIAATVGLLLDTTSASASSEHFNPPKHYYLALGDSMSVGLQPTGRGSRPTNQGYADDLYEFYRVRMPGLRLAKLGCPEETTTTMIVSGE